MAAIDRLMAKVSPEPMSGCWLWTGASKPSGYGNFYLAGKYIGAHRASYVLMRGQVAEDMHVCHHCDTPACVNPAHLFLGSAADNAADMDAKGRRVVAPHDGANNPMHGRRHSAAARAKQAAAAAGRHVGTKHPRAQVNEQCVRDIRCLRADGHKIAEIADRLNVSVHIVGNVINGKSWRHV